MSGLVVDDGSLGHGEARRPLEMIA